jgi:hypothetical protein
MALTGEREVDATTTTDYFAALREWRGEQSEGRAGGWN